jgi:tRNA threonylcarbamoyladenosine biosynthesis protein TsaB
VVYCSPLDPHRRTTAQFAGAIQTAFSMAGWSLQRVQLIAVCRGPGSFTGLRIGATVAKLWAYAGAIHVVAIPTLELLAGQADVPSDAPKLAVCLDAQRQQWFAGRFHRTQRGWQSIAAPSVVDPRSWLEELRRDGPWWITGPGLTRSLPHSLPPEVRATNPACWQPQAQQLGALAYGRWLMGQLDDPWGLVPEYMRPSAAEERRNQPSPPVHG